MTMKSTMASVLVGLTLLTSKPASAAEGLECIAQTVGEREMTRFQTRLSLGSPIPRIIRDAGIACGNQRGWSDNATIAAISAILHDLYASTARATAIRRGITENQLLSLQEQLRAANFRVTFADLESETANGEPLFAALRNLGLMEHRALSEIFGWLGALSEAEDQRAAFAAA